MKEQSDPRGLTVRQVHRECKESKDLRVLKEMKGVEDFRGLTV
jgi:hypothetical protein